MIVTASVAEQFCAVSPIELLVGKLEALWTRVSTLHPVLGISHMHPGLPRTALIYLCYPNIVIQMSAFHFQKCPVWMMTYVTILRLWAT